MIRGHHGAWPSKVEYGFCPIKRIFARGWLAVETLEECAIAAKKVGKLQGCRFAGKRGKSLLTAGGYGRQPPSLDSICSTSSRVGSEVCAPGRVTEMAAAHMAQRMAWSHG